MSGMLPGVELARRRRLNHHHQIGPKPSTRRSDLNACYSLDATAGESYLDQNTLRAKRRLEEKLWNLKPSCRRGWSKIFYHGDGAITDELSPETRRTEPLPSTTHENFQPSERDLCSACFEGFQTQQYVTEMSCFHGCIQSASALY
ncbi:unnamed protein product [Victoria cruziana]